MSEPVRRLRLLVVNGSGWGNVGDDASCQGVVDLVLGRRAEAWARPSVELAAGPAAADAGVRGVSRYTVLGSRSPGQAVGTVLAIARSDLVVLGGGGLLHDRLPGFYRPYMRAALLARALRKRVLWLGVGIQSPTTLAFQRWLARLQLASSLVSVRDEVSRRAVVDAGFRGQVHVVGDPALAVTLDGEHSPVDPTRVCVSLRPWWNIKSAPGLWDIERLDHFAIQVAQALDAFVDATGAKLHLLPMQRLEPEDDTAFERRVAGLMQRGASVKLLPYRGFRDVLAFLPTCAMTVGMRLHSLVLSALVGVPSVGISYDSKVAAFLSALGRQEHCIGAEDVEAHRLASVLLDAWDRRHDESWRRRVAEMRAELEWFVCQVLGSADMAEQPARIWRGEA